MAEVRSVSYTLVAHASGVEELRAVRQEIESIAAVRFNFESQVQNLRSVGQAAARSSVEQQEAERARQASLAASTASMNTLSSAVTDLTARLASMGSKGSAVTSRTRAVDVAVRVAAQGLNTLTNAYVRGGITQAEFVQKGAPMRAYLSGVTNEFGRFSKEASLAEKALRAAASSPVTAAFRLEQAAARELGQTINQLRVAWQTNTVTEDKAAAEMAVHQRAILGKIGVLEAEKVALREKGVLDQAETRRVQELTQLQNTYSQALRATVSVQETIAGNILKGSLAAGVKAGVGNKPAPIPPGTIASVNNYNQSLKASTAEVDRLRNAETAGMLTKKQLAAALMNEVTAQKAALAAIQAEALGLRELGVLDVQQTERLAQLTAAENGYTAALARSTVAQREAAASSSALRAGMAGAGARGGGFGNVAMGASLISPELGMVSMLASAGPAVAGVAAIGLGVKKVVDLTVQGQTEAKGLQQAYLIMSANGIRDIKSIDDALNQMTVSGSNAERMFSKSQLAGALAALARGGVKGADALTDLKVAAELAAAEHVPLEDAVKRLYGNLQHLDLEATDAATFGDKLARASHLSLASMDDLSKGLNVVGATAHTMGFSVEETLGMLVKLAQKGMDPATIGSTGLRNALQKVLTPSKEAGVIYEELGVKMRGANGHMRTGREIMNDLREAFLSTSPVYNKLTGELITKSDLAAMAFQIFGTRSATAFLGVTSDLHHMTDEIRDSEGFLKTYSGTVVGGLEGSQKRLDAATRNLSLAFAKTFTGALTNTAEAAAKFLTAISPTIDKLTSFFDLLDKAKTPSEIRATLKFNAADGFTLSAVKLMASGTTAIGQATGFVAKTVGNDLNADQLQIELLKRGILKDASNILTGGIPIFGPLAQKNRIANDPQHYIEAIREYDRQHAASGARAAPGLFLPTPGAPVLGKNQLEGGLALAGARTGTPFGNRYFGNQIHNGEDFFAPTGTPITAAFTGYMTTRWSETTGHVIELIDATGQKLLMGHLDHYAKGLEAAIKAAGGKLLVQQGQTIGYVGQTGSLAHADLGPGNSHTHVMAYDKNGKIVNPLTTRFQGVTGAPTAAGPTSPPDHDPNFKPPPVAPLKALQDEFTRLKAAVASGKMSVDEYHTAVQKVMTQAQALAETQKTGSKDWTATERLITATGNALKGHAAKVSQYGQAYDSLKQKLSATESLSKLGVSDASTLKQLNGIVASARAAADAEKARNGETAKYTALLGLAADAASKVSSINQKGSQATQQAAQRAVQAAQFQKNLNKQTSDGEITQQQAHLRALQSARDAQLATQKGDDAQQLQTERQRGAEILSVQKSILARQRDQAIQAAHDTAVASRAEAAKLYGGADKIPQSRLRGINTIERNAGNTARSTYASDAAAAASEAAQRVSTIQERLDAESEQRREKAKASQLAADQALADGRSALAKSGAQQVLASYDLELQRFGTTAAGKLAVEQDWQERRLKALNTISRAEAQAEKTNLEQQRNKLINAEGVTLAQRQALWKQFAGRISDIDTGLVTTLAGNQQIVRASVTTAQTENSQVIAGLRDKYHSLADSIREQTAAGTFDSVARQKALVDFNALGREVAKAGLTNDAFLTGARKVTFALVDMGTAAYEIQQQLDSSEASMNNLADQAVAASNELSGLGENQTALEGLEAALSSVMDAAGRGEVVGQAVSTLTAAIGKLRESLDLDAEFNTFVQGLSGSVQDELGQIADKILDPATSARLRVKLKAFQLSFSQEASSNILQAASAAAQQAGEQTMTDSDLGASDIDSANHDFITGLFKGPERGGRATAFLSGPDGLFGSRFWTELGEQGRDEFTTQLSKLTPDDFRGVSSATLKGLIEAIGDDPNWADLQKTLQGGLDQNSADAARTADYSALGTVLGEGQGALDDLNSGKTTAAEYAHIVNTQLVPALESISASTADSGVKEMAANAITALNGEASSAQQLADVLVQTRLATLDLDKAGKKLSEGEYVNRREKILTDQENSNYSEDGLSGQALLLARAQHEQRLTQIHQDGEVARKAITDKFSQDQVEATAAGVKATEDFMNAQGQVLAAEQQLAAAMGVKTPIYASEIEALEKLKALYPKLASQIDQVIAGYRRLQQIDQLLGPVHQLGEYINEVGPALSKFASSMAEGERDYDSFGRKLNTPWKDLAANIDGAIKAYSTFESVATDVGKIIASGGADIGSWVHLAATVISSIAEAIGGFKKAYAEAAQKRDEFNAGFTLINGDDYAKTFVRSRGFFADLFGGGPEVVQEIDQVGLKYAKTLESSIVSGVSSGMHDALAKNDFSLFKKSLQSSVYEGIVQGLIDGFETEVIKAIMAPAIKEFTDALATPGTDDDAKAIDDLNNAVDKANTEGQVFYNKVTPILSRIKPSSEDDPTSTDTSSSFGAVATAGQLAVGTDFLDASNLISSAALRFDSTITRAEDMYQGVAAMYGQVLQEGFPIQVDVNTSTGQQGQTKSNTKKFR